ncbi:hypothetical protein PHYPSEUDO_011638 [Phytophthora pseudosyringae]|uniref:Uncharacterized protein n=1 Tax=Phytophthora pseudosyringae TaxID=221518 RepID=A0A8T1V8Y7_9STRA|nr:hypothetical protein PHYPSEUDO_011638 [Phytophthora pseudosyringae]
MDVAIVIVNGLREIHELRNAIRHQRRKNRKTYMRMMEICVELDLSGPLRANPTLQRTHAIEKFAAAVASFKSYLRKYDDMHRVVRIFKHTIMEEERLNIVDEIDKLYRLLNLATVVAVMNGQASASSNTAQLFAKLGNMHSDIKLSHDQILDALRTNKQELQVAKMKITLESEKSATNVDQQRVLARQGPIPKNYAPAAIDSEPSSTGEDPSLDVVAQSPMIAMKQSGPHNAAGKNDPPESNDSADNVKSDASVATTSEVDQSTADVVIGATTLAVTKVELAELKQTTANEEENNSEEEEEKKEPINLEPEPMPSTTDDVPQDEEEEKEDVGKTPPLEQQLEDFSVPLLIQLLGSGQATAQQTEQALLHLVGKCVTNSNRVQVYKTRGISALSNVIRSTESYFAQLYALHCLSWFTFSYSKMRESEFVELQRLVRAPTHSEILSLLHDLQYGDEKVKEVAALQCSCLTTRGDGDALRRVGVLPLLIGLLTDGTANQKLWAAEALATLASDSDESCVAITLEGATPPLVALLRSGTDMQKQEAAYALGNLAANNEPNRAKIAREGAIPPMVAFVKAATDAQNQWAVCALGFLSRNNEENRVLIAQEGAIPPLVALLREGTRAQKQWSAYTLGYLAHDDANRVEITRQGAITPLIELLRTGTEMQKQRAAFALGNLACDNYAAVDLDEAIVPLVELVRSGSDSQKEDAAYTLGNIAASNIDRRAEIGRKGAIAPLVQLLTAGNGDQKQWAAFALRCLANENDANRSAIVEQQCALEALAALAEEGTDEQKEQAALALQHLVPNEDELTNAFTPDRFMAPLMGYLRAGITSQNANMAAAVREGVVPLFQRLMKPDADAPMQPSSTEPESPAHKHPIDQPRSMPDAW